MGPFLKARCGDHRHARHQRFSSTTIVFERLLSSSHFNNENDFSALDLSLDFCLSAVVCQMKCDGDDGSDDVDYRR